MGRGHARPASPPCVAILMWRTAVMHCEQWRRSSFRTEGEQGEAGLMFSGVPKSLKTPGVERREIGTLAMPFPIYAAMAR